MCMSHLSGPHRPRGFSPDADIIAMRELPPPGFYPDASDSSLERWWNGQGWSDTTRPRESTHSQAPPPVADFYDPTDSDLARSRATAEDSTDHRDIALIPTSGWKRFVARRSSSQVIALGVFVILFGPVASISLAMMGIFVSGLSVLIMLAGTGLVGYGILIHNDVRRRYGFQD